MGKINPFLKFGLKTKVIKVKALDGADVTIQELTVAQSTDFYKRVIKGFNKDGEADLDYNAIADIKIEKVSASMLEPLMSVAELHELSSNASNAIEEISIAIDEFADEIKK